MDENLRVRLSLGRYALRNPYAHIEQLEEMSTDASMPAMVASDDPVAAAWEAGPDSVAHGTGIQLISDALAPEREPRHERWDQIEAKATELLRRMWRERDRLWQGEAPSDPMIVIDPAVALGLVGYDFSLHEDLGEYRHDRRTVKLAGLIDHAAKTVHVSRRLPQKTRMFTAAHELGHAVLQHHAAGMLHRDRPLDGKSMQRDRVESEADKFASYFLMPAKLVRAYFSEAFGTDCFMLTEDTAFALAGLSLHEVQKTCASPRELSRMLAKAGGYHGRYFVPLADHFRVSTEAMAIRLEELGLIEPWLLEEE